MKIAIVVDQPYWTGVGYYAVELYKLLKGSIKDLKLIYVGAVKDDFYLYEKLNYLRESKSVFLRPYIIRRNYKCIIKDDKFRDYVFHLAGTDFSILKKRKAIITIHDLIVDKLFVKTNISVIKFLNAIERYRKYRVTLKLAKRSLEVITISKVTQEDISKKLGLDAILIEGWISDDQFKKRDKEECMRILGLDNNMKYFLTTGNDRGNKRLDLIKLFSDSLPSNYVLLKIGSPIPSKNCLNLGVVSYNLYPLYYNVALAYVHLSDNEGQGVPLFQSISCELPVVCRDIKINKEVLGNDAIYIPENTISSSVLTIIEQLNNTSFRKHLTELNTVRKEYFSPAKALNKYLEVYKGFSND